MEGEALSVSLSFNVSIFAGAGLSRGSGFVDWKELLQDIAIEKIRRRV